MHLRAQGASLLQHSSRPAHAVVTLPQAGAWKAASTSLCWFKTVISAGGSHGESQPQPSFLTHAGCNLPTPSPPAGVARPCGEEVVRPCAPGVVGPRCCWEETDASCACVCRHVCHMTSQSRRGYGGSPPSTRSQARALTDAQRLALVRPCYTDNTHACGYCWQTAGAFYPKPSSFLTWRAAT
jgi:hypothetical protein